MADLNRRRFALGAGAGLAMLVAGCREKKEAKTTQPVEQKPVTIAPAQQKTATTTPQPTTPAAPQVLRSGKLSGVGSYRVTGDFQIVRVGNVTKIVLAQNFSISSVPDPKIGFGNNGYQRGTLFAKVARNSGAQEYIVPANVDLSKHNELWFWCERFNIALGVGKLS